MTVVINEFEVIPENTASQGSKVSAKGADNQAPSITARDVADIVRHQMEREARVWAH